MNTLYAAIAVVGVAVLSGGYYYADALRSEDSPKQTVRWLIAHTPTELFNHPAEVFAEEFNKRSPDMRIDVKLLAPEDFGEQHRVEPEKARKLLEDGDVEMLTMPVAAMRKEAPAAHAFTLPYLFKDFPSAEAVLDGAFGASVLDQVSDATNVTALAYTLSGGYEVIETLGKKIEDADDLKGMRIGTTNGSLAEDTLRAYGAVPVPIGLEGNTPALFEALQSGRVDGFEITYTRLSKFSQADVTINDTNHSLFLTLLMVRDSFFDSLSPQNQAAFRAAAHAAALEERKESIQLAADTRARLMQEGNTVYAVPQSVKDELAERSVPVYEQSTTVFGAQFLSELLTAAGGK